MVFPWAVHFVETAMAKDDAGDHKFFLVTGVDAAHINGPGGGVYCLLVMVDANRNTVALAWGHYADNENDEVWLSFMEWVKLNLPGLDSDNVTAVRDGKKSISKALRDHLPEVHRLYCVRHAGEAAQINVGGGQASGAQYTALALALTKPSQDHVRNSTSKKVLDYIDRADIPEGQRLLCQFAILGGHMDATFSDRRGHAVGATLEPRHTSSFVESNNGAALRDGSRSLDPTSMTLHVAITWTRRLMAHKAESEKCTTAVPPQVVKLLDDLKANAESGVTDQTSTVQMLPGPSICAHVRPRTDLGNMVHLCNLTTKSCSCGFYDFTKFPCIEMAMVCKARGRMDQLAALVNEQDTTPYWLAQYDFDFAACMVAPANVWQAEPSPLEMPGGMRRKAGRPTTGGRILSPIEKARKRKSAAEDEGLAKPMAKRKPYQPQKCTACGQARKGHTCTGSRG